MSKPAANVDNSQYNEINAENIKEFIQAMEEHRATCEAEHRYVEAEMAKNRIAELKEQEFNRAQEELIFMHEQQRQECEQAHIKQYQEFNEHWDNELQQAQQEDQNEILQMEERHTQELEQNRQHLEATLPQKYKQSTELLNLRKIQENMAKQKNYQQAHQVQVRAQELEEKEREQYMVDVHKKILASEANMMAKQADQMAALKKKLEAKMNERLKMREVEHNKILQRYQNVKKEIENQQNIERIKRERLYQVVNRPKSPSQRSTMGASKMGASKMTASKMGASRYSYNPAGPSSAAQK